MRNILRALLVTAMAGLLFTSTYGQPGSVDLSFNAGLSVDFEVFQVALQSNGKIIIGGGFATPAPGLARLNADGSPDTSFKAGLGVNPGLGYVPGSSYIYALAIQPDDKIIIGGSFDTYNGVGRTNIARINADGTLDLTFDPGQGIGTIVPVVYAILLAVVVEVLQFISSAFFTHNMEGFVVIANWASFVARIFSRVKKSHNFRKKQKALMQSCSFIFYLLVVEELTPLEKRFCLRRASTAVKMGVAALGRWPVTWMLANS